ncbi:MAG: hypothetical protein KF841_03110 [Phycisphaerae bacterium]|nr:hypothetical protein [Phycisphaerae bacterium]
MKMKGRCSRCEQHWNFKHTRWEDLGLGEDDTVVLVSCPECNPIQDRIGFFGKKTLAFLFAVHSPDRNPRDVRFLQLEIHQG